MLDRVNSDAILNALLAKAKQHAANADHHESEETAARLLRIIEWARCADEIIAAKGAAWDQGLKLTNEEIGRRMGWKGDRSVQIILQWRRRNSGDPEVITSGPWDDSRSAVARSAAARHSAARRVARDQPGIVFAEILKHPDTARLFLDKHPDVRDRIHQEVLAAGIESSKVSAVSKAVMAGEYSCDPDEQSAPRSNPILRAWHRASVEDRREFVLELEDLSLEL